MAIAVDYGRRASREGATEANGDCHQDALTITTQPSKARGGSRVLRPRVENTTNTCVITIECLGETEAITYVYLHLNKTTVKL